MADEWVCPEGSVPIADCAPHDSTASPDGGARFFWRLQSGAAGVGPAVEILGDGTARGWSAAMDPTVQPAEFTTLLAPAEVTDLITRFMTVDRSGIPHLQSFEECTTTALVRPCAACATIAFAYVTPEDVSPELDPVWAWFELRRQGVSSIGSFNPGHYCAAAPP